MHTQKLLDKGNKKKKKKDRANALGGCQKIAFLPTIIANSCSFLATDFFVFFSLNVLSFIRCTCWVFSTSVDDSRWLLMWIQLQQVSSTLLNILQILWCHRLSGFNSSWYAHIYDLPDSFLFTVTCFHFLMGWFVWGLNYQSIKWFCFFYLLFFFLFFLISFLLGLMQFFYMVKFKPFAHSIVPIACRHSLFFVIVNLYIWFGLISLFNGISTFVANLTPKPSLWKDNRGII